MPGSIALVGSGEYLPAMVELEKSLIEDAIAQGSKCGAAVASTRGDWALMITGEKGILNYGGNNG